MRRSTIGIALTLFLVLSGTLYARTFVIAPGGNDSNAGSLVSPWRTIAKANATLQAGDTVLVRAGTYNEVLQPARSGQAGLPIVYAAYGDGPAVLLGESLQKRGVIGIGWDFASNSQSNPTSYIIVDGFQIRYQFAGQLPDVPVFSNRFAYVQVSHRLSVYNTIRNCTISQSGDALQNFIGGYRQVGICVDGAQYTLMENNDITGTWIGIWLTGPAPRFNTIRRNTIHDVGSSMVDIGDPEDGTSILQGNLIEGNTFTNSVNEDGIQFEPNYNSDYSVASNRGTIIRNNIVRGCVENAFDLKGAANIVIEGNIVYANHGDDDGNVDGNDRSGGMGGVIHGGTGVPGVASATEDVIIRNNVFFDNYGGIDAGDGYKIYNNTMINNNRDYTGPNSTWRANPGPGFTAVLVYSAANVSIKNNIFADQAQAELSLNPSGMSNGDVDYNMYSNAERVYFADAGGALFTQFDLTGWQQRLAGRGMAGAEQHSFIAVPALVNVPVHPTEDHLQYDFQLSAASRARDAGGPLTVTASGGSGQAIPVVDAGYFFDGFGRTDVSDSIVIGSSGAVKITAVDRTNNVIRVETPISWSAGAGVHRPYRGTSPDIGALESGGASLPATTPPAAIQLAAPVDGANGTPLTPTLSWNGASTVSSYQLQVSTGTAFISNVTDVSGITSTSFALPSLASNTVYYWRVRGVNQGGSGPWSGARSFTTIATVSAPPASLLATPADGTTGLPVTPTLTWNAVSTASSYQVQVSTGSAFTSTVVNASNITTTSYTSPPLTANTSHYWRVRGVNAGGSGAWSATRSFTTLAPTGGSEGLITQLVRNGGFESGTTDWTFSTGGTGSYTTVSPGYNSATSARVTITTTSTTMKLTQQSVPLNQNTMYRLSFAAKSSGGRDMTVGVRKQTSPTTSYGLQSRVIQLTGSWRTFSTYFQTANFTGTVSDAMVQFGFEGYARTGDRYWLDSVELRQATPPPLPSAPSDILPTPGAVEQPTTLAVNWSWVEDADGYRVQIAPDPSFSSAVVDTVVPDTVAIIGPLKGGTRYYRRIQTINISGPGPFSAPAMFTTSTDPAKNGPDEGLPLQTQLDQNFPNPFNPATVIRYHLVGQTHVTLKVFNLLGQEVATLVDNVEAEGVHSVTFNATGLPSGAYFCRLHADGVVETRKMMLAR